MTIADIIWGLFVLVCLYLLMRLMWLGDRGITELDEDTAWLEELAKEREKELAKAGIGAEPDRAKLGL